jgi:hypothetical protein
VLKRRYPNAFSGTRATPPTRPPPHSRPQPTTPAGPALGRFPRASAPLALPRPATFFVGAKLEVLPEEGAQQIRRECRLFAHHAQEQNVGCGNAQGRLLRPLCGVWDRPGRRFFPRFFFFFFFNYLFSLCSLSCTTVADSEVPAATKRLYNLLAAKQFATAFTPEVRTSAATTRAETGGIRQS